MDRSSLHNWIYWTEKFITNNEIKKKKHMHMLISFGHLLKRIDLSNTEKFS